MVSEASRDAENVNEWEQYDVFSTRFLTTTTATGESSSALMAYDATNSARNVPLSGNKKMYMMTMIHNKNKKEMDFNPKIH